MLSFEALPACLWYVGYSEQRRQASRDNSASPAPATSVQTQQPQSASQTHVGTDVDQADSTVPADAPPTDDIGIVIISIIIIVLERFYMPNTKYCF